MLQDTALGLTVGLGVRGLGVRAGGGPCWYPSRQRSASSPPHARPRLHQVRVSWTTSAAVAVATTRGGIQDLVVIPNRACDGDHAKAGVLFVCTRGFVILQARGRPPGSWCLSLPYYRKPLSSQPPAPAPALGRGARAAVWSAPCEPHTRHNNIMTLATNFVP